MPKFRMRGAIPPLPNALVWRDELSTRGRYLSLSLRTLTKHGSYCGISNHLKPMFLFNMLTLSGGLATLECSHFRPLAVSVYIKRLQHQTVSSVCC